ncbi:MAG: hypothetical protein ABR875_00365 [Minisyncoccia bacterium]|jgi:hypothetical protein
MESTTTFVRDLIKGRIAETIFEMMFRETGKFTILRFGYEYTQPELAQYKHYLRLPEAIENIDNSPDFILLSNDKTKVYLVEVKYRSSFDSDKIKVIAQSIASRWHSPYLFIATPKGFFFEPCNTIIKNNGNIGQLFDNKVPKEIQEKYLELLNEFERK